MVDFIPGHCTSILDVGCGESDFLKGRETKISKSNNPWNRKNQRSSTAGM